MWVLSITRGGPSGDYAVVPTEGGRVVSSQIVYTDSDLEAADVLDQMYQWRLKSDGAIISKDRFTQGILLKYPQHNPEVIRQ